MKDNCHVPQLFFQLINASRQQNKVQKEMALRSIVSMLKFKTWTRSYKQNLEKNSTQRWNSTNRISHVTNLSSVIGQIPV